MARPETRTSPSESPSNPFRLGFFTRLVDDVEATEVYRRALETFELAEALGYEAGWVAQHHAHKEGGLPSPLVLLAAVAARTARIKLVTGIIVLPLESPVRMAEDAAVLYALSGGRFELGFGTGGNAVVFSIFGRDLENRHADYEHSFTVVRNALEGKELVPGGPVMFPPGQGLATTIWEATFRVEGALRAAEHGSGLLLSRTMPRAPEDREPRKSLDIIQEPIVEAYLEQCASRGLMPRIGLSRSVYVAPTRAEAIADAEVGMRRHAEVVGMREGLSSDMSIEQLLSLSDFHIGSPEDVIASLSADRLLRHATDLMVQVHPVDSSHEKTLRSLRLMATKVAPALGWHGRSGA